MYLINKSLWITQKFCSDVKLISFIQKQAEKLKSREMKEGWMKNDEKDDDFKLLVYILG